MCRCNESSGAMIRVAGGHMVVAQVRRCRLRHG